MQIQSLKKTALAIGMVAAFTAPTAVQAQTENVAITAIVSNELNLTATQQMNFGIFALVGAVGQTSSVTVNPDGTVTPAASGSGAGSAVINDATAQQAIIEVSGGADTVAFNFDIDNVVNPDLGGTEITLEDFEISFNNGVDQAITVGAGNGPALTFDAAFNGGVNTVQIGAELSSIPANGVYPNGIYINGAYNAIFSY